MKNPLIAETRDNKNSRKFQEIHAAAASSFSEDLRSQRGGPLESDRHHEVHQGQVAEHKNIAKPIDGERAKHFIQGPPVSVGSGLDKVHKSQRHAAHDRRKGENKKAYEYFRNSAGQESQLGAGQHGAASVAMADRERAEF